MLVSEGWNRLLVDDNRGLNTFLIFVNNATFVSFGGPIHFFDCISVDFSIWSYSDQLVNNASLREINLALIFVCFNRLLVLSVGFIPLVFVKARWNIT